MADILTILLFISLTIGAYLFGRWVYKRLKTPLLIPIVVASVILVSVILLFSINYDSYMTGGRWIYELLSPAVVALAYPLYQYRQTVKKMAVPIFIGTFFGALIGVLTGVGLAMLVKVEEELIYSIAPKSVTTPVAMEISTHLGGIASLAAVFVIIAGISGAMLSPYLFKVMKIKTPIGKGISLGAAAHAIGTAKALEYNFQTGTFSTIAMILSTFFVSIVTPFIIQLLV